MAKPRRGRQKPLSEAQVVREMAAMLDQREALWRRAPAAGIDNAGAMEDIALLRQLMEIGGAVTAIAILTAWALDRKEAKIQLPDFNIRGGIHTTVVAQYTVDAAS